ncbi:MAG: hypothetical protein LBN27_05490 [Prevotellaceae bacterium]|jgi:hypothetical protein|nr:hypothetical protein [Prevotellaceae bacterium]
MEKKCLFIAGVLILAGSLIYAICRQDAIIFHIFGKPDFLDLIKIDIHYNENIFVYFLLFCLPDMLWYMALLLIQKQFYDKSIVISKILFYGSLLLPFALEIMQYFNVITGTFDIADILFYLLILLIFLILWKRKKLSQREKH